MQKLPSIAKFVLKEVNTSLNDLTECYLKIILIIYGILKDLNLFSKPSYEY